MGELMPYSKHCIDADDLRSVTAMMVDVVQKDHPITRGPLTEQFETDLQEFLGAPMRPIACSSGTMALDLAFSLVDRRKTRRLYLPKMSFMATYNAAFRWAGTTLSELFPLGVNYYDVDDKTLVLEETPARIENDLKGGLSVVMVVVSIGGRPWDREVVKELHKAEGLTVIEDACHALSPGYCKDMMSDIACFSFHPSKLFTTGEGGAVVVGEGAAVAAAGHKMGATGRVRVNRNSGLCKVEGDPLYNYQGWNPIYEPTAFNGHMTEMQAALGISQLKKAAGFHVARCDIAFRYLDAFLDLTSKGHLWVPGEGGNHWHLFDVEDLTGKVRWDLLPEYGITRVVHYPIPRPMVMTKFPYFEKDITRRTTLPLYPGLKREEQCKVIEAVYSIYQKAGVL